MQTYSLVPSRNLIMAERGMLKHAMPMKVISTFGMQKEMPTKKTDTVVFRRAVPIDADANGAPAVTAANYALQEGVTPNARTITYQDVQCTVQNYGVLMKLSSKAESLYEDDIPGDMQKLVGEHMATIEEQIAYGVVRGGTNVVYANGTTQAGLNTAINLNRLRQCARVLERGRAARVSSKLSSSVNFGTQAVAAAYLVFCHTDCENDVMNLPGFKDIVDYGSAKPLHEREFGACGQFRFVSSPEFRPTLSAGAAVAAGTFLVAGGVGAGAADVYPYVIVGEEAWGQVAVKGMGAIDPTYLPAKLKTHANPMGMFGYVGCTFWKTAIRLNENWMIRLEAAVTAL